MKNLSEDPPANPLYSVVYHNQSVPAPQTYAFSLLQTATKQRLGNTVAVQPIISGHQSTKDLHSKALLVALAITGSSGRSRHPQGRFADIGA
jgi:hypothetical protein